VKNMKIQEPTLITAINHNVGRPFCARHYDCWAFLRGVYADAYGIILPALPGTDPDDATAAHAALERLRTAGDWLPVDPGDERSGDAVIMGRFPLASHHCGIWIVADGIGRIAHCDRVGGVQCQTVAQLHALGWSGFRWYRHHRRQDAA